MTEYAIRWNLNEVEHLIPATSAENAAELVEAYAIFQPTIVTRTVTDWTEVA